jgi:hypothetical protein
LSPLLFNLVVDSLATLMKKAKEAGLIRVLVPELVEVVLTHLQYADDTVICLETDEGSIANTKFLLYCFENMSRLKINYHKSEVMVLGISVEKIARNARLLNCKEGSLPMKYLGIPVSKTKLYSADLMYVGVKVKKRLPAWQVMGTREGLNPDLSVETEDNSIGKESRRSRPDYNRPETLRLSNRYTNARG